MRTQAGFAFVAFVVTPTFLSSCRESSSFSPLDGRWSAESDAGSSWILDLQESEGIVGGVSHFAAEGFNVVTDTASGFYSHPFVAVFHTQTTSDGTARCRFSAQISPLLDVMIGDQSCTLRDDHFQVDSLTLVKENPRRGLPLEAFSDSLAAGSTRFLVGDPPMQ